MIAAMLCSLPPLPKNPLPSYSPRFPALDPSQRALLYTAMATSVNFRRVAAKEGGVVPVYGWGIPNARRLNSMQGRLTRQLQAADGVATLTPRLSHWKAIAALLPAPSRSCVCERVLECCALCATAHCAALAVYRAASAIVWHNTRDRDATRSSGGRHKLQLLIARTIQGSPARIFAE